MKRDDPAYEGQREYTPLFLKIYDPLILGFFTPVVWRCPTTRLVEGYRRHLGHRHLDVGPGTGYFLERAGIPDGSPVTLLESHFPSTGRSTPPRSMASSIACQDRSRARPLPSPTWPPSSLRRASSSVHRSSGSPGDTQEGLGEILEASFERVELETVGSMAIFAATNPRTKPSTGMTP